MALIDLTDSIASADGTARVNRVITGRARVRDVATVSFDVGVPQRLMKQMIASHSPEGTPSPLGELYWSWNSGYRHVALSFAIEDGATTGAGTVHVGSRDCGPSGARALSDRDRCTYLNTPRVSLSGFDLANDTVGLDLRALLAGLDLVAPIRDQTGAVIGQGPGVECHSAPSQADCATLFANLGIDMASGDATAAANRVFVKR